MNRIGSGYCQRDYTRRSAHERLVTDRRHLISAAHATGTLEARDVLRNPGFVERACVVCAGPTRDYLEALSPTCFTCSHARNPYAKKNARMSVDATGEDSTNPERVKDGSNIFNVALPPVEGEVIGKDAYGQIRRKLRPVAHNEVSSARKLKERAKRAGLTPMDTQKRAVG